MMPRPPRDTQLPSGAARVFRIPIQLTSLEAIALAGLTLRALGPHGRTDHLDVMLAVGRDQKRRGDIPRVHQVDARQQIALG